MKQEKMPLGRTISEEFFQTIQMLRRAEDAAKIVRETGLSRVTVDKALNTGYVRDRSLENYLFDYYTKIAEYQNKRLNNILKLITNGN